MRIVTIATFAWMATGAPWRDHPVSRDWGIVSFSVLVIAGLPRPFRLVDYLLLDVPGHGFVMGQLHRVAPLSASDARQA